MLVEIATAVTVDVHQLPIEQQVAVAISEATLILFLLDGRAGITALDREIATMLRRSGVPLLVVANKRDGVALLSLADPVEPVVAQVRREAIAACSSRTRCALRIPRPSGPSPPGDITSTTNCSVSITRAD